MNNNSEFLKLAREKFSKLTKAEILLLKQIQKKGGMNYTPRNRKKMIQSVPKVGRKIGYSMQILYNGYVPMKSRSNYYQVEDYG